MVTPNPSHRGDPLFLPEVLRAFGVRFEEFSAWRNRGQGDFGKIWGVVAHHTGSNNASPASIAYGHPGLQGLLSQIHLDRTGKATIVGAGIAWHAGRGSWPGIATNNANAVTIGIEANSDGVSPWPAEMLDAYYRICAGVCWYLGLPATRVIGHKEWAGPAQGKWDPGGIDMDDFRSHVQYYIDNPPFIKPDPPKTEAGETMEFWNERVPSLVDASKSFTRAEYLQLIDYHATLGDQQSRDGLEKIDRLIDETRLLREDLAALVEIIKSAGLKKGDV